VFSSDDSKIFKNIMILKEKNIASHKKEEKTLFNHF
jgi:hypothetical protein